MKKGYETVFIIGYGAIGKVLAVCLTLAGRKVIILRGSIDTGESTTKHIKVEMSDGSINEADITVDSLSNYNELDGLIILANKSFGNEDLAYRLKNKAGASPIVVMQNGLNVEQSFIDESIQNIYRCVLFATSLNVSDHDVRFRPVSSSPIGLVQNETDDLIAIVETLSTPSFQFHTDVQIQAAAWKKTIVNCAFNSICPLLNIDNGIFHRDERALALAQTVVEECNAIALASGVVLDTSELLKLAVDISKSADGQLISTLQDLNNGRQTEIRSLNLAIAAIAAKLGMQEKVKVTESLGKMIQIKESLV